MKFPCRIPLGKELRSGGPSCGRPGHSLGHSPCRTRQVRNALAGRARRRAARTGLAGTCWTYAFRLVIGCSGRPANVSLARRSGLTAEQAFQQGSLGKAAASTSPGNLPRRPPQASATINKSSQRTDDGVILDVIPLRVTPQQDHTRWTTRPTRAARTARPGTPWTIRSCLVNNGSALV